MIRDALIQAGLGMAAGLLMLAVAAGFARLAGWW